MCRRFRLTALIVATALAGAACATSGDAEVTGSRALSGDPGGSGGDTADVPSDPAERDVSYDDIISMSLEDIQAFWRDEYPAVYGGEYEELAGGVWAAEPDSTDLPGCGEPETTYDYVAGNAYYCSVGDFVMYDNAGLFPDIYDTYGPWVIATVLAHEWGHAIQHRANVNETSIIMEQQADCFAGAWTRWIDDGNSTQGLTLPPDALNDAMSGFIEFKDPAGLVSAAQEGAHGSAFDRVSAFRDGFNNGAVHCATYPDNPPVVFEWPYLTAEDEASGGNEDYDVVLDATVASLDRFWLDVYIDNDLDYASLSGGLRVYGEDVGPPPPCGDRNLDDDFYAGNIFYCPDDDYIAFDEPGLMLPVYDEIGDFADSLLIGNAFADRVQTQLNVDLEGKDRSLQADCMSGAWVRDILERANAGLADFTLSPGDLDEGVIAFLRYGDSAEAGAAQALGTPFERVDKFRAGLLDGLGACAL